MFHVKHSGLGVSSCGGGVIPADLLRGVLLLQKTKEHAGDKQQRRQQHTKSDQKPSNGGLLTLQLLFDRLLPFPGRFLFHGFRGSLREYDGSSGFYRVLRHDFQAAVTENIVLACFFAAL